MKIICFVLFCVGIISTASEATTATEDIKTVLTSVFDGFERQHGEEGTGLKAEFLRTALRTKGNDHFTTHVSSMIYELSHDASEMLRDQVAMFEKMMRQLSPAELRAIFKEIAEEEDLDLVRKRRKLKEEVKSLPTTTEVSETKTEAEEFTDATQDTDQRTTAEVDASTAGVSSEPAKEKKETTFLPVIDITAVM